MIMKPSLNAKTELTAEKRIRLLCILVAIGSIFAALKTIFVGYCHDEEYQIVMAYRSVTGDSLFSTMWEPHQTSAFLNAFLIRIFMLVTGGTEWLVVYLRVAGTVIQSLIALLIYSRLKIRFSKTDSFLLSLVWFNSSVGLFASAENSNMEFWFLSVLVLSLYEAYDAGFSKRNGKAWLFLASLSVFGCALSLPSLVFLFPVALILLLCYSENSHERILTILYFTIPCAAAGVVYCLINILNAGPFSFLNAVKGIFTGDPSHSVGENSFWISKILPSLRILLLYGSTALILTGVVIFAYSRIKVKIASESRMPAYAVCSVISLFVPLTAWLIFKKGYEYWQVHIIISAILIAFSLKECKKPLRFLEATILWLAVFTVLLGFVISNMELSVKIPHAILIFTGFLIIMVSKTDNARLKYIVLFIWLFFLIFSKGFILRSGSETNNILSTENVCRKGPGKGIFSEYMRGYIMDSNYDEWPEYVQKGDNVLVVTQTLHSDVLSSYMFEDVNISHYSTIDPYSYSEKLLEYWSLYPGKYPDIIAVDCWYGDLLFPEDSWIMHFIENDFGYTQVNDGKYLRYYSRKY